jgi:hypothetical protein
MQLPRFEDPYCKAITACGQIRAGDKSLLELLGKKTPMIASYTVPSGTAYLQVLRGEKHKQRLHIDCALAREFAKGPIPKVTHEMANLQHLLNRAVGSEIDVRIIGTFVLPLSKLPEPGMIRSLLGGMKTGNVEMRLTAGTLSISGAPISEIRWSIMDRGTSVRIEVRAGVSKRIEDSYLPSLVDWVNQQFLRFVLGRTKNANA